MTNPNNIVQGKHLESLASDTRSYILAKDLEVIQAVQADLEDLTFTLGTVPATVDGGLWRDGNALKMKVGAYAVTFDAISISPIPTNLPITIDNNIVTVNGLRFQLNGFKSNLTAQNGLLFSDGTQCGVVAVSGSDYIFQMSDVALDTENLQDGDTVSITPLDTGNVSLIFIPSISLGVGYPNVSIPNFSAEIADEGEFFYQTIGKTNYVVQSTPNSYSFFASDSKTFLIFFDGEGTAENNMFNGVDDFVDRINNTNLFKIEVSPLENASSGKHFKATVYINEALFAGTAWANTSDKAAKAGNFWCYFDSTEEDFSDYEYEYKLTGSSSFKLSEHFDATFAGAAVASGGFSYTFNAPFWSEGYFAGMNDNPDELFYRKDEPDNNGFTISGLIADLVLVGKTDGSYELYSKSDDNVTVNEETGAVTVADGAKVYATISKFENKKATVTINTIDAIAKTSEATNAGYCNVVLTDIQGDKQIFNLKFDESINLIYDNKYSTPTFTLDPDNANRYNYVDPAREEYFSPTYQNRASDGQVTTMTYTAGQSAVISFGVSGLKENLASLSVVDGYIVLGAQTLASFNDQAKTISIYSLALPSNPDINTSISLVDPSTAAASYKVRISQDSQTQRFYTPQPVDETFRLTDMSNQQNYDYIAQGKTAGFYNNYDGGISFRMNTGAETFSITSLAKGRTVNSIGTGKPIEFIDAGNNLTYVKVSDAALTNGSTTGTKGDIVLTDSNGYWDGKLFALMLDSSVPQLDANNQPTTVAAASLTLDSVAGTATYTGTTYDEYYFRVPSTLPAAGSTDTYVTTAKYFDHAGGDSFLICGLSFVDGISQQLVTDNISVTETGTTDTLTGEVNVNYNFAIGSALKNNLQSGKYITISSRDTQNFSPTIVTKE